MLLEQSNFTQTQGNQKKPTFKLDPFDIYSNNEFDPTQLGNGTPQSNGNNLQTLLSTLQGFTVENFREMNRIQTQLRCCYTNEVKSAKELKISMKGENPSFYPTIQYSLSKYDYEDERLDLRTKKPLNMGQGLGQNPNPLQTVDDGAETLYNTDLDRWLINNQNVLEKYKIHRGIARIYSIVLYRELELDDLKVKFKLMASTGFLIKIAGQKFLLSCLNVIQSPEFIKHLEQKEAKIISFATFGNKDILPLIYKYLKENKTLVSKNIKSYLLEKYFKVITRIKPNKLALAARREWLINNSRCSEIIDSEFYYQMIPSLDMAIFDIDQQFLKDRQIKVIDYMKPDSRYQTMVSIGFSTPIPDQDIREYKIKYGCSKGVSKNENLMISMHKTASFGKVKSYGSVTTVVNSAGVGSQGSPCFNEMGKCWGFMIGSHNDVPDKYSIEEELELMKSIDQKLREEDSGGKKKDNKKDSKKSKKKEKKKKKDKKRDKKNKKKQGKKKPESAITKQNLSPPDLVVNTSHSTLVEYFDVKSNHCLIPLIPSNNSHNRNMVLTFSHSGVRYIIDKIQNSSEEKQKLLTARNQLFERDSNKNSEISKNLRMQARYIGQQGLQQSIMIYDGLRQHEESKNNLVTVNSSERNGATSTSTLASSRDSRDHSELKNSQEDSKASSLVGRNGKYDEKEEDGILEAYSRKKNEAKQKNQYQEEKEGSEKDQQSSTEDNEQNSPN
ncbi:UNKNOWN [Stylonychia lemnae]|uniref:Uncharacterized protein n=1 Tax=Stylonychia lemnae TaxID=5949 RepID=A0A078B4F9_STYLE|nr:UNKNOWN [Stylonychia lemnae]|eukprot:CDW89156.1 UNKNOWN [Stylonychia lemnae]